MTTKFFNEHFDSFTDESSGRVYSDFEFHGCHFIGGGFSSINLLNWENRDLVNLRSVARNMLFRNCRVSGVSFVGAGIVENCLIENLRVSNHLQSRGTVFKHVTFKGKIDKLMLVPCVDFTGQFPDIQKAFDDANDEYYRSIDWAIDISEAFFKDCDIRAIPAKLIKRDVETQAILTRSKAKELGWEEIDLSRTHWRTSIEWFLDAGYEDTVLVASKRAPNFRDLIDGINRLRVAGVLEPN